jgi:hypothetical protein
MDEDAQFSALLCEYVLLADALWAIKGRVAEEVLKRYPAVEEYDKVHRDMKALLRNALNPADQQFLRDTDNGVTSNAEDRKRRKTILHRINRWFNEIRIAVYQDTEATSSVVGVATAENPIMGKSMYIAYYSDQDDYSETDDSNDDWEAGAFDCPPVIDIQIAENPEDDSPAVVETKSKRKGTTKRTPRRSPKSPSSSAESDSSTESFETLNNIDDFDAFVDQVINFALYKFDQKIDIVVCDDEDEEDDDGDDKITASVNPIADLQLPEAPVHSPTMDSLKSRFKQLLSVS